MESKQNTGGRILRKRKNVKPTKQPRKRITKPRTPTKAELLEQNMLLRQAAEIWKGEMLRLDRKCQQLQTEKKEWESRSEEMETMCNMKDAEIHSLKTQLDSEVDRINDDLEKMREKSMGLVRKIKFLEMHRDSLLNTLNHAEAIIEYLQNEVLTEEQNLRSEEAAVGRGMAGCSCSAKPNQQTKKLRFRFISMEFSLTAGNLPALSNFYRNQLKSSEFSLPPLKSVSDVSPPKREKEQENTAGVSAVSEEGSCSSNNPADAAAHSSISTIPQNMTTKQTTAVQSSSAASCSSDPKKHELLEKVKDMYSRYLRLLGEDENFKQGILNMNFDLEKIQEKFISLTDESSLGRLAEDQTPVDDDEALDRELEDYFGKLHEMNEYLKKELALKDEYLQRFERKQSQILDRVNRYRKTLIKSEERCLPPSSDPDSPVDCGKLRETYKHLQKNNEVQVSLLKLRKKLKEQGTSLEEAKQQLKTNRKRHASLAMEFEEIVPKKPRSTDKEQPSSDTK